MPNTRLGMSTNYSDPFRDPFKTEANVLYQPTSTIANSGGTVRFDFLNRSTFGLKDIFKDSQLVSASTIKEIEAGGYSREYATPPNAPATPKKDSSKIIGVGILVGVGVLAYFVLKY